MINSKPYNSGAAADLQTSSFLFNVFTRQVEPEAGLVFKLNGFQIRQDYKYSATNFNNFFDFFSYYFRGLELRKGENFIQVSREYPDNRTPESLGWMKVFYNPKTSEGAKLTGWSQDQISKNIYVYGHTQPGMRLLAELGELRSRTRANDLGLFALRFDSENDVEPSILDVDAESSILKVKLSETDWTHSEYDAWNLSSGLVVHEGSYEVAPLADPASYSGNIAINIHNENRNADILFSVNIPQKNLIEEAIQKNRFTSRELAGLFFGFGVTQSIEYFEFYDVNTSRDGPGYNSSLIKASYESSVRDKNKPLYENGVLRFGVTLENLDNRYSRSLGFYDNFLPYEQSFVRVSNITLKAKSLDTVEIAPYFLQYSTSTNENDIQVYTFQDDRQDAVRSLKELITFDPNSISPQQNQESSGIISARPESLVDFLTRLQSLIPRFLSNIFLAVFSSVPFICLLYVLNYEERLIEERQNSQFLINLPTKMEPNKQPNAFIEKSTIIYAITNLFLILNLSSLAKSFSPSSRYLNIEYTFLIFASLLGLSIFESYKSPETRMLKASRFFSGKLILFSFLASILLTSFIYAYAWWMPKNSLFVFPENIILLIFSMLAVAVTLYIICIFIFVITSFSVGRWLSINKVSASFILTIFFVSLPNIVLLGSHLIVLSLPAIQNFGANDLSDFSNAGSLFNQYQDYLSILLLSLSTFLPRKPEVWIFVLLSTTFSSYLGITILSAIAELKVSLSRFLRNYYRIVRLVLFAVCFPIGVLLYESTNRLSVRQLPNELAYDYLIAFLPYLLIPVIIYLLLEKSKSEGNILDSFSLNLGALLFSYYLLAKNLNLILFLPLLVLGYFLFRKVIISDRFEFSGQTMRVFIACRNDLLKEFLAYKEKEYLFSSFQRNLLKRWLKEPEKIADEEVESKIENARSKLVDSEQKLNNYFAKILQAQSASHVNTIEKAIFGLGFSDNPIVNSKAAIRYGLLLSLPFTMQPLVKLVRETSYLGFYPPLAFFMDILGTVTPWLLIAFIFGFFFHFIRGNNGLTKGLIFGFSLLFPLTIARLLSEAPFLNVDHISYIFQNFTYILLLGILCFDFQVISKSRYGWRDLLSVYGIVTIGLSLLPASIPVIAALLDQEPLDLVRQIVSVLLGIGN